MVNKFQLCGVLVLGAWVSGCLGNPVLASQASNSNLELSWRETCDADSPVFFNVSISKSGKVDYDGHYGVRTVGQKTLRTSSSDAAGLFDEVAKAMEEKNRSSQNVHPVGTCLQVKLPRTSNSTSLFYEDDAARAVTESLFNRVNLASVVCPARRDLLFSTFACEKPILSFAYQEHSTCDPLQNVNVYSDLLFHYYLNGSRGNDEYGSIKKTTLLTLQSEVRGEHEEESGGAGMTWQLFRGDVAREYWQKMVQELKLNVVSAASPPCDGLGGPYPLGQRGLRQLD